MLSDCVQPIQIKPCVIDASVHFIHLYAGVSIVDVAYVEVDQVADALPHRHSVRHDLKRNSYHPYAVWFPICLEMTNLLLILAMRVVEVLFFTGLVGCAMVIVISWISIFGDGFSDPRNKETESHWASQHETSRSAESRQASASLI